MNKFLYLTLCLAAVSYQIKAMEETHPLHTAVYANDLTQINEILTRNPALVNQQLVAGELVRGNPFPYERGNTPLHIAAFRGHLEAVRLLIARGANINIRNHLGCTPLYEASSGFSVEIVRLLCKQPTAQIDQVDDHNCTPLCFAVQFGRKEIARFLIKHGATVNWQNDEGSTPLHLALDTIKRDRRMSQLMQEEIPNWTPEMRSFRRQICDSTISRCENVVRLLVLNGAALDIENHNHQTPRDLTTPQNLRQILQTIQRMNEATQAFRDCSLDVNNRLNRIPQNSIDKILGYLQPEDF